MDCSSTHVFTPPWPSSTPFFWASVIELMFLPFLRPGEANFYFLRQYYNMTKHRSLKPLFTLKQDSLCLDSL